MKEKWLNLYGGIGGNRFLWDNVDVTAVEIQDDIAHTYQRLNKNDKVIIGDAHEYLLEHYSEFDGIWSSPPCQKNTRMIRSGRNRVASYPDLTLYEEIIFLKHNFKGKWVVENVKPYYEPLIRPTAILGRHYFWSNFYIPKCDIKTPKGFITNDSPEALKQMKDWLGIQFDGNIYYKNNHSPGQVLRNCVHPVMGLHILNAARKETIALFNN